MGKQVKFLLNFSNAVQGGVYDIVVFDRCGNKIFHTRTQSTSIAICCSCYAYLIQVTLELGNISQTLSRFLLSCYPCEMSINFAFALAPVVEPRQDFTLFDRNYGFPINRANLLFQPR